MSLKQDEVKFLLFFPCSFRFGPRPKFIKPSQVKMCPNVLLEKNNLC